MEIIGVEMPPLLAAVAAVCAPRALPGDVARVVDAFVDPSSRWTAALAVSRELPGLLRLLARVAFLERGVDRFVRQKRFADALELAAGRGDVIVVRWLVERYMPDGVVRGAVRAAVAHGRVEVLEWLRKHHDDRVVWWREAIAHAPDAETARWLHENLAPISEQEKEALLVRAMELGHLQVAQWVCGLRDRQPGRADLGLRHAASGGHTDVLKWAVNHLGAQLDQRHMNCAVSNGKIETAQWLRVAGMSSSVGANAIRSAMRARQFDTVKWALMTLVVSDVEALGSLRFLGNEATVNDLAASRGRMDILELLLEIGAQDFTILAMDGAASGGHLDIVMWLHEHRSEGCSTAAMDGAAGNGHLDVVRWLHQNRSEGCTVAAMDRAAAAGKLEVAQWLQKHRSEGCTMRAMDDAATNGHLEVVRWLHTMRAEGCSTLAMEGAAISGHLNIVKFLHENRTEGCSPLTLIEAAISGHLEIVKWFHEVRGEEISSFVISMGWKVRHAVVLDWLLQHYSGDVIEESAMENAVRFNQVDVILALDADGRCHWGERCIRAAISSIYRPDVAILLWLLARVPVDVHEMMRHRQRWRVNGEDYAEFVKLQEQLGA